MFQFLKSMWDKMFTSCVGETVLEINCQDRDQTSQEVETTISSTEVAILNNDRNDNEVSKNLTSFKSRKVSFAK